MISRVSAAILLLAVTAAAQEREDDPAERYKYFREPREYPTGRIPEGARMKAFRAIAEMERSMRSGKLAARAITQGQWKLIGPQPIGLSAGYIASGRVSAIAVDPRNNDVAYAGGAAGGVWKTTDGGTTWTPLTDDQPSLATGSIALDPSNPDTIYVGTGEEAFSADSYYGAGILKSTDGGATWTNVPGPFLRARIGELAVHPQDGRTILASSTIGLYRSNDAGATWTLVRSGTATSVFFEPGQANNAWAAIGSLSGSAANGVYRSTDAGATWMLVPGTSPNEIPSGTAAGRIEIAPAPASPGTVYAAVANASKTSMTLTGVYSTNDGGKTWTKLSTPDFCAPQCWYNLVLSPHPTDPRTIFAGGVALIRSMNSGATWQSVAVNRGGTLQPHPDHHALVFTNDGTRLYDGDDGGVWSTDRYDTSTITWNNLNATLALTQYYPGQAIHPTNPQIGLGGAQDNGTNRYGGQLQWDLIVPGVFADSGWQAIDASSPGIAYTTTQTTYPLYLMRTQSLSTANTFVPVIHGIDTGDRQPFIAAFILDPVNPQRMYYGTYRLYRSEDGGGLWRAISPDLTVSKTGTISGIAVSPADPDVIYTTSNSGAVFMTPDGGNSWNDISASLPIRAATHVAVDPVDPLTVYVTFSGFPATGAALSGHIYKSRDGGNSWTDISGNLPNLPVDDLVIDPDLPDTLYAATDLGVMVTTDAGTTWTPLGTGLPRVPVLSLVLHRPTRTLRAASHGRSMWDYSLGPVNSVRPVISSLSPAIKNAGDGAFALTINGSNLGQGMRVWWNGQDRQVTAATATSMTVQIPASDIQGVGRVAVVVFNPSASAGASIPASFVIGPAPAISNGGLVSAADTRIAGASPGAFVSLYGLNLAGALSQAVDVPWPYTLGGVTVTVGSGTVPLYFVSPSVINFQVPFSTNPRQTQSVTVSQGTLVSATAPLAMSPVTPALFTTNQQGTGQGAIRIADATAAIAAPAGMFDGSRPAKAGEFISIYCTGLGVVTPSGTAGAGALATPPLQTTVATPIVTIGNIVGATVQFSGLTPGLAGLYQVNVKVPDGVTPGNAVPLSLTISGVQSNTVTVAIQ